MIKAIKDWLRSWANAFRETLGISQHRVILEQTHADRSSEVETEVPEYSKFGVVRIGNDFVINGLKHEVSVRAGWEERTIPAFINCGDEIIKTVLARGIWPDENDLPVALSDLIQEIRLAIKDAYLTRHKKALTDEISEHIERQLIERAQQRHDDGFEDRFVEKLSPSEKSEYLLAKRKEQEAQEQNRIESERALLQQKREALPQQLRDEIIKISSCLGEQANFVTRANFDSHEQAIASIFTDALNYPDYPKPSPLPHGADWRGAELLTLEWLRYLGFYSATKTPFRRDGGVDVETNEYVVQTKKWDKDFIPVSAVREIIGSGVLRQKKAMFFSSSPYSADALSEALAGNVALFIYGATEGTLRPMNDVARDLVASAPNEVSKEAINLAKNFIMESFAQASALTIPLARISELLIETSCGIISQPWNEFLVHYDQSIALAREWGDLEQLSYTPSRVLAISRGLDEWLTNLSLVVERLLFEPNSLEIAPQLWVSDGAIGIPNLKRQTGWFDAV